MDKNKKRPSAVKMKYLPAIVFFFGVVVSTSRADEVQKFADQKGKESYSLGYNFGQTLKAKGIDINLDIYTAAIRDALGGKEPLMSQEEMRVTVKGLEKRFLSARQAELEEKAAKNLLEARTFLEENKNKGDVTVLPSGLQYRVLKEGTGKIPKISDTVTVHYRGTLIDGTEFDSSLKRGQPATFKVNGVIKGWSEALQLMRGGSKWQLFVPPALGYGERGNKRIPPNSVLIFELELISDAPAGAGP